MKDFKTWWAEADIFAGEGSMDAAEQAWDEAQDLTAKRCKDEAAEKIEELQDFAIWLTGCGYDFAQHKYFCEQRDKLLLDYKHSESEEIDQPMNKGE